METTDNKSSSALWKEEMVPQTLQVCLHVGSKGFKYTDSPTAYWPGFMLSSVSTGKTTPPLPSTGCSQEGTIINSYWECIGHRCTCCCHHSQNVMKQEPKWWTAVKVVSAPTGCLLVVKFMKECLTDQTGNVKVLPIPLSRYSFISKTSYHCGVRRT